MSEMARWLFLFCLYLSIYLSFHKGASVSNGAVKAVRFRTDALDKPNPTKRQTVGGRLHT